MPKSSVRWSKLAAGLLWIVLGAAILAVVIMVWHPWVHPWSGTS